MFSREEYEKTKKKEPKAVSPEIVRTAPQMEYLTNSEEWNKYLSYIQTLLDQARSSLENITSQLLNPSLFEAEKMFQLKSEHARMAERIEVIETLMSFPKQIIELGKITSNPIKEKT